MGAESGLYSGLQPGVTFDGRFVVERVVGAGGMGLVIAAHHLDLNRRVAIKIVRPALGEDTQGRRAQRLVHEARAAARLESDHGLRIFDVVSTGAYAPYIVMEYLDGESLSQRLRRGRLPLKESVGFTVQACEAVGEAHHHGIVHRDLKPSNLFLLDNPSGRLKVLDFGIARGVASFDAQLTDSYALLGSPGYAAPEQLQSPNSVDQRADIWSLGVVLFECLTGLRPFEGKNLVELYNRILNDPPRSLRGSEPKLPRALEAVIAQCLAKDPAQRFDSAGALVQALREFAPEPAARCLAYLGGLSAASQKPRRAELEDVPTGTTLTSAAGEIRRALVAPSKRSGGGKLLGLAAVLLFLVGSGFWLWSSRRPELAAPPAASSIAVDPVPRTDANAPVRAATPSDVPPASPEASRSAMTKLAVSPPLAAKLEKTVAARPRNERAPTRAIAAPSSAPASAVAPSNSASQPTPSVTHPRWTETR